MSYFSIALQRLVERHHMSQADIARASGLSKSYISRLATGAFTELSDPNFLSLLKAFGAAPLSQAELVAARCNDARACAIGTPGGALVQVEIKGARGQESPEPRAVTLSPETERAFAWLRSQCPLNAELERHLVGYAKLTGMK